MERLVSILMPAYNAGKYLQGSIGSILGQTYGNFELIIINDGSTDNTEEIVRKYKDPRIRYFSERNQGVAKSLNFGLHMAAGDLICRHDADDISLPGRLRAQTDFLLAHEDISLCGTQIAFMTERGKISKGVRHPKRSYFNDQPFRMVRAEDFTPYSPIVHATVLGWRSVFARYGGYRPFFTTGEDVDLWLRMLHSEKIAVMNSCQYFVRLHSASNSTKQGARNEAFRSLSFEFYRQREGTGQDDLERGLEPVIEIPCAQDAPNAPENGGLFRSDLLDFLYPVNVDAGDWKGAISIITASLKSGWRVARTWKSILFPLLGPGVVEALSRFKRILKPAR